MLDTALQPFNNEVRYHPHGSGLVNTALQSTNHVTDTPRNIEAAGASIAPAGTEMLSTTPQMQHLHAPIPPSMPTNQHQPQPESDSSSEEVLPGDLDGTGGGQGLVEKIVAGVNDIAGLSEVDAALLISPMISRTQSATLYDQRRSGSSTRIPPPHPPPPPPPPPPTQQVEGYLNNALGGPQPQVVVSLPSTMPLQPDNIILPDATRKDPRGGALSQRLSSLSETISGLHLTPKNGPGRNSPPSGISGTPTPKQLGKRSSMFTFNLPSFHLPQKMPSPPSFLSEMTTRKRSKSSVLGSASKTQTQSPRNSGFFNSKQSSVRDINSQQPPLQRPPLAPLRRSSSHPSLLSYTSSLDEDRFSNVQTMTNARLKALKDNFRVLSPGNTIQSAANALSVYANTLNTALSSSSPMSSLEASIQTVPCPFKSHPLDTVEGDIVVMGGYRGSILREASGQRRRFWIPLRVGLNLRRVKLEIGLNDEDEETMSEKIIADGMLTHIGPVDISKRLLRRLRAASTQLGLNGKKYGQSVWEYGYDWRLSPHILSRQLIAYLEQLPCNRGNVPGEPRKPGRGALVIAHSLGGLIVRHAMNQRPELFSGVLFAGTPQHCVNILGPLRNGDTVLLSSRVLNAQVNFTLRSSYALLPESGECFVDKKTGKKITMDFFDVNTWIRYSLSPCVVPPKKSPTPPGICAPLLTSTSNLLNYGSSNSTNPIQSQSTNFGDAVKDTAREGANAATKDRSLAPQMDSTSTTLNPFSQIPSFLEDRVCTLPLSETIPYLERTLRKIKQFKQELSFRPEIGYPPVQEMGSSIYTESPATGFSSSSGSDGVVGTGVSSNSIYSNSTAPTVQSGPALATPQTSYVVPGTAPAPSPSNDPAVPTPSTSSIAPVPTPSYTSPLAAPIVHPGPAITNIDSATTTYVTPTEPSPYAVPLAPAPALPTPYSGPATTTTLSPYAGNPAASAPSPYSGPTATAPTILAGPASTVASSLHATSSTTSDSYWPAPPPPPPMLAAPSPHMLPHATAPAPIASTPSTHTSSFSTVPEQEKKPNHSNRIYYPPMAILYANNTPTVKGAKVDGVEGVSQDNVYDELVFGAGDGVCLAKAAQLPTGYKPCARVLTDRGHISLLGDLDSVGKAIEAIVRERGW